ncbi:hypothetical protein CFP56_043631, partial [Quercus suber]
PTFRHFIESNTDRILIVQEQNACIPFDYFSVNFHDENHFGKRLEIYQPLHCSNMSTDVLSCCDGLFCIYNQWGEEIAIWNPLVRKYRKLPSELTKKPCAFGYDKHNDDYKVLRVWLRKGRVRRIFLLLILPQKFRVITKPLKAPTSCYLKDISVFIVIVDEMYNDV